jgi:hypothetical protein
LDEERARCRANVRRWRQRYPEKQAAASAVKRARRLALTPALTTLEAESIREIYRMARQLTKITGKQYHVDHVYPLARGGLHHPANLQVMLGVENIRKGVN